MKNIKYLLAGVVFGIILIKSQVVSWFRIQEMFRLQAFHMYGIIGSAIFVGMISILIIKRFNIKSISGEPIVIPQKQFSWGNIIGDSFSAWVGPLPALARVRFTPSSAAESGL